MGCAWYRMAPLFLMLLCGLTTYCIFTINEYGLRSRVQHLRDKRWPRIKSDLIITRNITAKATETGLVFCNDTRLMPEGTFPPIALASFPGSGNTWVRHLIETATGYATGSVYGSGILSSRGFIGEREPALSGRALTIKTHGFKKDVVGAILLLRNPYRAMVSEYNRRRAGKTGHAHEEAFKTAEWRTYVNKESGKWIKLYKRFISECHHSGNTCKSTLIVYYGKLQLHLMDELRRILEYLHITIDEERLACAVTNAEGQFHRPKSNKTLDPFSMEDRNLVDKSLNLYRDLIDREGLEKPPLSFYSYPSDL